MTDITASNGKIPPLAASLIYFKIADYPRNLAHIFSIRPRIRAAYHRCMRNEHEGQSDFRVRLLLAAFTTLGAILLASTYQDNTVRGAASGPAPRVTAITQVTHNGYGKENRTIKVEFDRHR